MPFLIQILLVVAACALLIQRRGPWLWAAPILLFPIIGPLVYLVTVALDHVRPIGVPPGRILGADDALDQADRLERRRNLAAAWAVLRPALEADGGRSLPLVLRTLRLAAARGLDREVLWAMDRLRLFHPHHRDPEITALHAQAQERLGAFAEAELLLASIADDWPGEEMRARRASLLQRLGRREEATALYRRILDRAAASDAAYCRDNRRWIRAAEEALPLLTGAPVVLPP